MAKFMEIIEANGIENVLFMVPMRPVRKAFFISYTTSDDPEVLVPATIIETRYKLSDNYKIELKSTYEGFGRQSYYVTDFQSLLDRGITQMYVNAFPTKGE